MGKKRKPVTQNGLARLLNKYKDPDSRPIAPKTIRFGEESKRGYYRRDSADAWLRYLPSVPDWIQEDAKRPHDDNNKEELQPQPDLFHSADNGCESATATQPQRENPNKGAACSGVAVEKGDVREEESVEGEL
jgi:hypothetical protein